MYTRMKRVVWRGFRVLGWTTAVVVTVAILGQLISCATSNQIKKDGTSACSARHMKPNLQHSGTVDLDPWCKSDGQEGDWRIYRPNNMEDVYCPFVPGCEFGLMEEVERCVDRTQCGSKSDWRTKEEAAGE